MMTTRLVSGPAAGIGSAIRTFNKHITNPAMLLLAGRPGWYAARLEHRGRRSGRAYATPVVATEVPGGFVVPLPYGPHVDWLLNLQAADGGTLVVHGRRFTLSAPRVSDTSEIYAELPRSERIRAQVWRIGHWLRVEATPADTEAPPSEATPG
jgi:deazaflavin-dependent oxidoreductase (nitroreductase family)